MMKKSGKGLKKVKLICCVGLMLLGMVFPKTVAKADVVIDMGEYCDFAGEHRKDCTYCERDFYVEHPNGKGIFYKAPDNDKEMGTLSNDTLIYVSIIYTDKNGIEWGYTNKFDGSWIPMDYLEVKYDEISFGEEHKDEIKDVSGIIKLEGEVDGFEFYKYPNSPDHHFEPEVGNMYYDKVYKDQNGKKWGYVNYYHAQSGWYCINDPKYIVEEKDIDYGGGSISKATSDNKKDIAIIKPAKRNDSFIYIVIGLVVGVIVITAALLLIKMGKEKGKNKC